LHDNFVFISLPRPEQNIKKESRLLKIGARTFRPEKIEDIIDPKVQKREYQIFKAAKPYAQTKALKYLLLFKAVNNRTGRELSQFLEIWNINYPDYKTSLVSYYQRRKDYLRDGISSLLPSYGQNANRSVIPDDIYYKFRELYLSPKKISAIKCISLVKEMFPEEVIEMESSFPSLKTFLRRINKEFKKSEIEYFRNMSIKIPDFIKTQEPIKPKKRGVKSPIIKTFKEAGKHFLKSDYCKNLKPSTLFSYKGYVENQLTPYFYEIPLTEITEEKVNEFKHTMLNDGLSTSTVNKYIDILIIIVNTYSEGDKLPDSVKFNNERNYYQDMRILEADEVKKILLTAKKYYTDFYPLLLTAISTGMSRGEILGLTWQDILWKDKQIQVKKSLYKGELVKHRTKNSIRNIDISDDLILVLKDWKNGCVKGECGFVFPNSEGEAQDPDNMIKRRFIPTVKKSAVPPIRFIDLRDIYASLLIKQNLPLIYIQEQLGHSSPQVTAERYKFLLEKNQVKNLNVLDGVL